METESVVRYERLRPAQIVARREACPVAYLPIGTIEWHGEHNPVGLDTLKIHRLLEMCAQKIGGLVFPPLYYGENREEMLMEAEPAVRVPIAEKMGLPAENFAPGYMFDSEAQQSLNYQRLLIHIMSEIRSLGFKVLVIGAGHYPLIDHARAAAAVYHQFQRRDRLMITWAMSGYELVQGLFEPCGDHAAKWETSLLMYLDPGMQDLNALPPEESGAPLIGVLGGGTYESNIAFGRQAAEAIVAAVEARVTEFLAHPERYSGHGSPM